MAFGFVAFVAAAPLEAQTIDQVGRDQARRAAEADAAARQARERAPQATLGQGGAALGPFPEEAECRPVAHVVVDGALPHRLGWVAAHLARFDGRCVGEAGLNYILRSLQAAFLDHGLTTTRAGYPQQDLSSGTLRVAVVPGIVAGVRGKHGTRAWRHAFPGRTGNVLSLRTLEQGLDQMRRIPGREVKLDLVPGDQPGETFLDLTVRNPRPVSLSLSVNNLAGPTIGRWQGTAQLSTLNLLGLSEIATLSINNRLNSPSLPADSYGDGISLSVPFGWWTFGVGANRSRYAQRVVGEVRDFDTTGRLDTVSAWVERVVRRDRTSKTALRLTLQRRWGRSFIDGVEIGLQRQDLTDIGVALIDRRRFGRLQIDSEIAHRRGVPWLGAQAEGRDRPASLPSARYGITSADIALSVALSPRLGYRAAFHGQWSDRTLYGSDQIAVGGPFTVRGFDSDRALLGRSGWYLRQEASVQLSKHVQPYGFADLGGVVASPGTPVGVGMGLRAQAFGAALDAWVAAPVAPRALASKRLALVGVTLGWTL